MQVNWTEVIDSIPTECPRNHMTVEMINFSRQMSQRNNRKGVINLSLFCPSCHQKLKIEARELDSGRWAATSYETLQDGNLQA